MDVSPLSPNDLAAVDDITALLEILQDKLGWELDVEDVTDLDDVTYDWGPEELALKPEHRAKLREIKQLRPFESDQGWAVFFVSFESEGRLPITVLRRVLRGLTLRGRNASAEQSAWNLHDLLFISSFGKGAERELAFAHFHDEQGGDLPRLSVLGWDEADTDRRKALTAERLAGLSYEPDEDADARRERWRAVFQGTKRQAIRDSKTLAKELAGLAAAIRGRVNELIAAEDETGHLRRMHAAFQRTLIEGLSADDFADTFAQTVAYGLLTAAFSRTSGALVMQDLVHMVPPTNPFLRGLFERFLHMGGQDRDDLLDYDELGLRDVIDLLAAADLDAVRADFGTRKPGEDPVIHFYEDFLSAYDKQQKVDAGVFYTPQPVVNFIVRGVDQMLREEFGLPLGLADRATLGEVAALLEGVTVPEGQDPNQPFVRILDPATGTGTFLVEAIELIHARLTAHWADTGEADPKAAWQVYVKDHLLPNMSAFELKMAPYAIAHMKVGLKLQDTGYDLSAGERLRVFLTNAMQPARAVEQVEMDFDVEVLAEEAAAANAAKSERHSVVVGNPPYNGNSQNKSKIRGKLTFAGRIIDPYTTVLGAPLGEQNPKFLQNDYVKFIGLSERTAQEAGGGVVGKVTSSSWLEGTSFRGMRAHLQTHLGTTYIVDLHGHIRSRANAPGGGIDEGVFDIEEGTAILLASHGVGDTTRLADLWGPRGSATTSGKLRWLTDQGLQANAFADAARGPILWKYALHDSEVAAEYAQAPAVTEFFPASKLGFQTHRDHFAIAFDEHEMRSRLDDMRNELIKDEELCDRYRLKDNRDWQIEPARRLARNFNDDKAVAAIEFRPFDVRSAGLNDAFMDYPRANFIASFDAGSPILNVSRQQSSLGFFHAIASRLPTDWGYVSDRSREGGYMIPLFFRRTPTELRRSNVSPAFARTLAARTNLTWDDGLPRNSSNAGQINMDTLAPPDQRDLMDQGRPDTWDGRAEGGAFGPHDLFDYIYAVLHAPSYRSRYAEFLRSDFPRIPLPGGAEPAKLFRALAAHGRRLTALHLLDVEAAPELGALAIRLAGTGSTQLGKKAAIQWADGKVHINGERWFEHVPEEVWAFRIGGYQPAQKWLQDRAEKGGKSPRDGRTLTEADILHYRRFVTAMQLTIPKMAAVDATIEQHGGWPDAFAEAG